MCTLYNKFVCLRVPVLCSEVFKRIPHYRNVPFTSGSVRYLEVSVKRGFTAFFKSAILNVPDESVEHLIGREQYVKYYLKSHAEASRRVVAR